MNAEDYQRTRDLDDSLTNSQSSLETFSCSLCSKKFEKKPSRNRHQLYCRKRSQAIKTSRKIPCGICRKAKTKCNLATPSCSRCVEKKLSCVYESFPSREHLPSSKPVHTAPFQNDDRDMWGVFSSEALDPSSCPEIFPSHEDTELTVLGQSTRGPDLFDDSWSSLFGDLNPEFPSGAMLSSGFSGSFAFGLDFHPGKEIFFDSPYLKLRYLTVLHSSVSRRSELVRLETPFIPTSSRTSTPSPGHSFILQNLRSYPPMILDTTSFHPFIHRNALPRAEPEVFQSKTAESLAICQSIVQLHKTKTPLTSSFIWRTMAAEQQRMKENYEQSGEWDVLAMLQSMTIYILIRIFDEGPFTVEFDNQLIETMTAIAIKLEQSGFLCNAEVQGQAPQWDKWILMESIRRTVTILFIIHLLFDINPGQRTKAMSGLSQLPLPANKNLWSARTEEDWRKEVEEFLKKKEGRASLTYRDLVTLNQGGGDPRIKDLNDWYVNLDALGMLVMMAATSL